MSNWQNFKEAYKDEAKDAMDNRNYGPLMALTVFAFWGAVIWIVVRAL